MKPPSHDRGLAWLRRDLRIDDNAALSTALASCRRVVCVFVFDRAILRALPDPADRRVEFIHASLLEVRDALRALGGTLLVVDGDARDAIPGLAAALRVDAVFAARDYEPGAVARDRLVGERLARDGRSLVLVKDQVVFDTDEVMTGAGRPYAVFTPYRAAWLRRLESLGIDAAPDGPLAERPVRSLAGRLAAVAPGEAAALGAAVAAVAAVAPVAAPAAATDGDGVLRAPSVAVDAVPSLGSLGFAPTGLGELGVVPGATGAARRLDDFIGRIDHYHRARDFPAVRGPSYLSVHLRFGTVSIRRLAALAWARVAGDPGAAEGARTWLSELIWREFYFQVLHHHPYVVDRAFQPAYDSVAWLSGPEAERRFDAWREGRTGYPLVDAAMLQLTRSGYMHNRLRMVAASFLCKHLGIDWRRGERWFARLLLDYDLAANNGGWQWAASTGCDAQPWFRIFNPVTQSEKFDAQGRFIRRYLPQLAGLDERRVHAPWLLDAAAQARAGCIVGRDYPAPIVEHRQARAEALERYGRARG